MADYSYLGSGKIYARIVGAEAALIEMGNCSNLSFAVNENTVELKDFTQPGGGTYSEVRRIDSVEVSITAHDLDAENLRKALFGTSTTAASATISAENVNAYKGGLNPLAHPADTTGSVEVTNEGDTVTYTEGTDYELRPAGLWIPSTSTITNDSVILVTYDSLDTTKIEALTNSAQEYQMVFEGLNEARSGKPVKVVAHRVKIGAAQNLSLIGEDYAALEMSGKVLKDATKTGSLSQYFVFEVTG